MHWSEKIAQDIIARRPDKEEYVCAAGISPSGSIHIGNFRDVATSYFVVLALRRMGKKARLLFSWDEYDRLRKVPKNVADLGEETAKEIEKYIGCCYVDTPNPFKDGSENYAELELVRLACPRRVFTLSQIKYCADRVKWLYDNRHLIGGLKWVEEPAVLRFFFGKLQPLSDWQEKLAAKFREDFGDSL